MQTLGPLSLYIYMLSPQAFTGESVWPSGNALGWETEGPRFESAEALLFL